MPEPTITTEHVEAVSLSHGTKGTFLTRVRQLQSSSMRKP